MTKDEKKLIREFFTIITRLRDEGIVRSEKILGDIGEWLCNNHYNLELTQSGRNPGFDGKINDKRIQVKLHNSPKGTNINVGNPSQYEELYIIIGPSSRLRCGETSYSFQVYRFSSTFVMENMKRKTGYYCARKTLTLQQYEKVEFGN